MMVGPAFTVAYGPRTTDTGTVGDYIDSIPRRSVVVISNQARVDCTVWGDLLTYRAVQTGLAGTVIDGAFRDVDIIEELGYPMYARQPFMVTGKGRVELVATMVPVTIGGVEVLPRDLICADGSGVVAIPSADVDEVVEAAEGIAAAEARILVLMKNGESLESARQEVVYHLLQQHDRATTTRDVGVPE